LGIEGRLKSRLIAKKKSYTLPLQILSGQVKLQLLNGPNFLRIGSLSIADGATLDLASNDLVVQNADIASITQWIKSARNGGAWNQPGLSSTSATTNRYTTLAAVLNDRGDGKTPIKETIGGQNVGLSDVLVKYTWDGDANLDGVVNADDYFQIDSGYISQKKGYYNGDFNYDGVINADDYFLIDSAYIGQSGQLATMGPVATPPIADACNVIAPSGHTRKDPLPTVLRQLFSDAPVV